ncbi:MAG: hypothetical protein J6K72_09935 [Clostridia bacterium]|nr:hypothetical protein [Clostridia bacterium]
MKSLLFFFSKKEKKQKKNLRTFFFSEKESTKEKPASTRVGCGKLVFFFLQLSSCTMGLDIIGSPTPNNRPANSGFSLVLSF